MATPQRHLDGTIARLWPELERLVAAIAALIGLADGAVPGRLSRAVRIEALRLIRPAETLVRHLIVLKAREMMSGRHPGRPEGAPGPRDVRTRVPDKACRPFRDDGHGPSHFHLFEPLPTAARIYRKPARRRAKGPGPRILRLDAPWPYPRDTEVPEGVPAGPVVSRLRALQAAMKTLDGRAKRHARFLARHEAR